MKRLISVFLLFAAVSACTPQQNPQQEPSSSDGPVPQGPPSVITATFPDAVITKVGMSSVLDGLSAVWMEDDFLTISNGTASERFVITSISEGGKTATLEGSPLEGEEFSIMLCRFEEDYLNRTYKGQKQLAEDSVEHMLAFDALLEGVDTYSEVTFSESWAQEHGGSLTQSGSMILSVDVPDEVSSTSVIEKIRLVSQEPLFRTTNNPDFLERDMDVSTGFAAGDDRRIDVYMLTSMAKSSIPSGTDLTVLMTVDGVEYIRSHTVADALEINPGKLNTFSIEDGTWKPVGQKAWIKTTDWTARYTNATANNGSYAELNRLFDMDVSTIWHSPWRSDRTFYDPYYQGWTVTEKSESNPDGTTNGMRLPMECVIDMGAEYFLFTFDIKRRAVDNGSNKTVHKTDNGDDTCCAEVWVSTDTSNEEGITMLSITQTSVLNEITEKYSRMWAEKKWHKVGDVSWDKTSPTYYNDVVARITTEYLSARYIKLVIPGPADIKDPILSLSEVNVYGF